MGGLGEERVLPVGEMAEAVGVAEEGVGVEAGAVRATPERRKGPKGPFLLNITPSCAFCGWV